MNPERILLNLHLVTQARLRAAHLPYGVSRTKWINDAICQRLDRDCPNTLGVSPDPDFAPKKLKQAKGPYLDRYQGLWQHKMARRQHLRLMREKGESPGIEALIEAICIRNGTEMSQEEKDRYAESMEVPGSPKAETLPPAPLPTVSKTGELSDTAEYLALVKPAPAPADTEDEDADFWGETFHKIKAKAGK